MKKFIYLITILSFTIMACKETKTVMVKSSLVDCQGEAKQKCMQYKEAGTDNWQLFYGTIEGFTYEEGYTYELEVDIEKVENPPADGSSLKYTLKRLISKKQDLAMKSSANSKSEVVKLNNDFDLKKQENPIVEYDSHTRGFYNNISVYENHLYLISQRGLKPNKIEVSDKDISEIKELIKSINLKEIAQLESPTKKRLFDGAPHTNVIVYSGNDKFKSSTFDGGFPPAELKKLVDKILSLTEKK